MEVDIHGVTSIRKEVHTSSSGICWLTLYVKAVDGEHEIVLFGKDGKLPDIAEKKE